jgi:mRNA interferase MazF
VWWANLPDPIGPGPGYRRPVMIVQADPFNTSRIRTVVVVAISSNPRIKAAPGNVHLPARASALFRDSVANVTQLLTIDKELLLQRIDSIPPAKLREIDGGLRLVLAL